MTSSELRECADYIERLCIVACRRRQTHVACENCHQHAERLRKFALELDVHDPRSSLFPPNQRKTHAIKSGPETVEETEAAVSC